MFPVPMLTVCSLCSQMAVSFSVSGPSTHEYPSEASLLASETTADSGDGSASTGGLGKQ